MNLAATLSIYGGGPGSGCVGPNCGRPSLGGYLKNTKSFIEPPHAGERGSAALDHYVVHPDGTVERVLSHVDFFSQRKLSLAKFLEDGGITITVGAAGPGMLFGKKDEDTLDKILQVAGHPMFRELGATVEYLVQGETTLQFDGSVGTLARQMRRWVGQEKVA